MFPPNTVNSLLEKSNALAVCASWPPTLGGVTINVLDKQKLFRFRLLTSALHDAVAPKTNTLSPTVLKYIASY